MIPKWNIAILCRKEIKINQIITWGQYLNKLFYNKSNKMNYLSVSYGHKEICKKIYYTDKFFTRR